MTLIPVNSSAIAYVGYDYGHLYVVFHSSPKMYDHPGVPYGVFEEFMEAASMGHYYARYIRDHY